MTRWTRKRKADGAALCLELGAGLLENGAETSRVEETIRMAGAALGMDVEAMVHPTGITVGFGHVDAVTRVARIKERTINLAKVVELNRLSRSLSFARKDFDLQKIREQIEVVRTAPNSYSDLEVLLATAVTCGCLTVVVGGALGEVWVAMLAGCIFTLLLQHFESRFPSFLSHFTLGFVGSLMGVAGQYLAGLNIESIVVGSLLYQMPGLAIVSATRDLMSGELVAGNARLAEAVLVTLGMASGVLGGLGLMMRVGIYSP